MSKLIKQNFYSLEKYVYKNNAWHLIKNNEYLYSNGIYPTKLTAEDLPNWFLYGRFYKTFGYISTKNVVDLVYNPNLIFNHFLKDDFLYISYKNKITKTDQGYVNYDHVIYGMSIIEFINNVQFNSNYDTSTIKQQLVDKFLWFKKTYPDENECKGLDVKWLLSLLK